MGYQFEAPLWLWDARKTDSWTFVTLPVDLSDDILDAAGSVARGFGSVRVEVTVGATTWRTSIFPGKDAYVLPIKRAVRQAEGLEVGSTATVALELTDVG